MAYISVVFGADRNFCGRLSLIDDDDRVICGPFAVAGRASSLLAARHGNPTREPTLPYGDTPTGVYRVTQSMPVGHSMADASHRFGGQSVLLLQPVSGDAALAEANGRFHLYIQADAPGDNSALRSSAGSLRLKATAMAELVDLVATRPQIAVHCVEAPGLVSMQEVFDDETCNEEDPPGTERRSRRSDEVVHSLARRRVLRAGVVSTSFAMSGAVSFFSLDAAASPQAAHTAYPDPEPAPQTPPVEPETAPTSEAAPEPAQEAVTEPAPAPELAPEGVPEPEPQAPEETASDQAQAPESSLPDETEKAELRDAVASPAAPATGVQTNPAVDTAEGQEVQNSTRAPSSVQQANTLDALKDAQTNGTNNLFDGGQGSTGNATPNGVTQAPVVSSTTASSPAISPELQQRLNSDPAYARYDAAARQTAADEQRARVTAAQLQTQYLTTPDSNPDKQSKHVAAAAAQAEADRLENQRRQAEAMKRIEEDRVKGQPILLPKKH